MNFSLLHRGNFVRSIIVTVAAFLLAACEPVSVGGGGPSINTRKAVPVALLLPQSAAQGGFISQSFENAARLAIADLGDVDIDLRVYDTGGNPQRAAQAADQAASDGAKIVLGPIFSDASAAAGAVAARNNLNLLSFSNNPAIAGGNVFILGQTFQNSADRLVGYAASRGLNDILIVHADSPAEVSGRDAIQRAMGANGVRLAGSVSFPLSQDGLINAIPAIGQTARSTGAQSIFMTSGTDGAIPFLAELLPENGVDNREIQFIGLQRLDIPQSALSLDGLQGAWFAVPDPGLTAQFGARYAAAFGASPHPLAGLAYDGVAAIGALVATNDSAALTAPSITRASGFAGANGVFRLQPNGTIDRGLAVATIEDGTVTYIDPAPRSFGGAGF